MSQPLGALTRAVAVRRRIRRCSISVPRVPFVVLVCSLRWM